MLAELRVLTTRASHPQERAEHRLPGQLSPSHLWRWNSTAQRLYESPASADGMGLLGCLSGILVVQAGAQAFRIMNLYDHTRELIILRWLVWSVALGAAGGAACGFSWNDGPVPVNKTLTSLSYCLVTSSIAFFVQTVLYFLVDWKKIWTGRPFNYAGENSLLLYVGSEMLPLHWHKEDPTHSELFVTHVVVVLVWLTVAVLMHRYRIIITEIRNEEIMKVMKLDLKARKDAGYDGLMSEMLKGGGRISRPQIHVEIPVLAMRARAHSRLWKIAALKPSQRR
ncbi:Heparan-alpha-glucosaminide N-acetyltransferase [Eumeta japonica]|uniref:Heparan-alpha-glucosaminide N-acetyltransferase n=1 Tax=Eumeta variegata TaxID=151549 RepID=A0A4C1UWG5_EUMVA|nr:Heparan-alpha-glucosaminide N-acetyltransferase [Eumeta japonica]